MSHLQNSFRVNFSSSRLFVHHASEKEQSHWASSCSDYNPFQLKSQEAPYHRCCNAHSITLVILEAEVRRIAPASVHVSHDLFCAGSWPPQFAPVFQALSLCPRKDAVSCFQSVNLVQLSLPCQPLHPWKEGLVSLVLHFCA